MLIDCDTCPVQGEGCPDCVVAFLLDQPPRAVDLDASERRALGRLAAAGLVPPLRSMPDQMPSSMPAQMPGSPRSARDSA